MVLEARLREYLSPTPAGGGVVSARWRGAHESRREKVCFCWPERAVRQWVRWWAVTASRADRPISGGPDRTGPTRSTGPIPARTARKSSGTPVFLHHYRHNLSVIMPFQFGRIRATPGRGRNRFRLLNNCSRLFQFETRGRVLETVIAMSFVISAWSYTTSPCKHCGLRGGDERGRMYFNYLRYYILVTELSPFLYYKWYCLLNDI